MTGTDFEALSTIEQSARLQHLGEEALRAWAGNWTIVRLIKYRENAVFEVAADAGERAVLRIHRNGYHDDASLRSEISWMDALGTAGLSVPLLVRTRDGALFAKHGTPGVPDERQIDMFRWIDARPVADIDDPVALASIYREVGQLAAKLHRHGDSWTAPGGFARHHWNGAGLIGKHALWGDYQALPDLSPDQRALLDQASRRAEADLKALEGWRYGLIHADLVADNLLHGPEGLRIIDFDDSGYGWHMFELATALFFHLDTPPYPAIEQALLEGYRSVLPLADAEWRHLPLFLFARSLTYLGWVCSRPETETAREQTGPMTALALKLAEAYLAQRPSDG